MEKGIDIDIDMGMGMGMAEPIKGNAGNQARCCLADGRSGALSVLSRFSRWAGRYFCRC